MARGVLSRFWHAHINPFRTREVSLDSLSFRDAVGDPCYDPVRIFDWLRFELGCFRCSRTTEQRHKSHQNNRKRCPGAIGACQPFPLCLYASTSSLILSTILPAWGTSGTTNTVSASLVASLISVTVLVLIKIPPTLNIR